VPLEAFPSTTELHRQRWPQVLARARSQREALAKLANRVSERARREAGVPRPKAVRRPAAKKKTSGRGKPAPKRR
jgi:hypothetical protein